jgi:hypothetical protein
MTKTVTLLDGTDIVVETGAGWGDVVCLVCGADYITTPSYCDESLDCAFDDGEHLVKIG